MNKINILNLFCCCSSSRIYYDESLFLDLFSVPRFNDLSALFLSLYCDAFQVKTCWMDFYSNDKLKLDSRKFWFNIFSMSDQRILSFLSNGNMRIFGSKGMGASICPFELFCCKFYPWIVLHTCCSLKDTFFEFFCKLIYGNSVKSFFCNSHN